MPWLWLKPIWYACGRGFTFNRLVKVTRAFTMQVGCREVLLSLVNFHVVQIIHDRRRHLEEEGMLEEDEQVTNVLLKR